MKFKMPIEDKDVIAAIGDYLQGKKDQRDYVLFMTGIYLGRRISDMLQYRVRDLRNKDHIAIPEGKTGKVILLPINPHLKKIYKQYFKGKKDYEYVFRNKKIKGNEPIGRVRAWQILKEASEAVELRENISCKTLRKTFGYWLYVNSGGDVVLVQELYGHAHPSITQRYIGIDQQKKDNAVNGLHF